MVIAGIIGIIAKIGTSGWNGRIGIMVITGIIGITAKIAIPAELAS